MGLGCTSFSSALGEQDRRKPRGSEDIFPAKYRGIPRLAKPFEEAELEQMVLREFSHAA